MALFVCVVICFVFIGGYDFLRVGLLFLGFLGCVWVVVFFVVVFFGCGWVFYGFGIVVGTLKHATNDTYSISMFISHGING